MEDFLRDKKEEYKKIGFIGCDFSENTLCWQLVAVLFRTVIGVDCVDLDGILNAPKTGWGEHAYLWLAEKLNESHPFAYCGVGSKHGDTLYFFDYRKGGKGDHRDFFGNERYINIFCDICRGENMTFSMAPA